MTETVALQDTPAPVKMTDGEVAPSRVLGVFGLSIYTRKDDLDSVFRKYGAVESINLVHDRFTGRSKGFAFVYFADQDDADSARRETNGLVLNERTIRVDYSKTARPHDPTPGQYAGRPTLRSDRGDRSDRSDRSDRGRDRDRDREHRYVPSHRRSHRSRSRSRGSGSGESRYRREARDHSARDHSTRDYGTRDHSPRDDDRQSRYRRERSPRHD